MVEGDFHSRFQAFCRSKKLSYGALAADIYTKTGRRITAQSLHKWAHGKSYPTEANLEVLANYSGRSAVWWRYGLEADAAQNALRIGGVITSLPDPLRDQVIDYLRYKVASSAEFLASEQIAEYVTTIDDTLHGLKRPPKRSH